LHIQGTWLEERVNALYAELAGRGLVFRPPCYLADEWLTPDDEAVIGIPFYLAHPRLKELEQKMMHDVEGGEPASCMRLLRHEAGHAINYAYRLYNRKECKRIFGHFHAEYPERYKYQPYSKSFVIHLEDGYAQYHPDEDFAETFAVWLTPESDWRTKYAGWKALEKLEYVDALMQQLASRPRKARNGKKYWNISTLKATLATHYKKRSEFYEESSPQFHDACLRRIFPGDELLAKKSAERVLARHKKNIVANIALWTGERKYVINRVYKKLQQRARALALRACPNETQPLLELTAYITTLVMNYIYTCRFKRKK
jgi:hypothetical protein